MTMSPTSSRPAASAATSRPPAALTLTARLQPSSSLPALQAAYQARLAQLAKPYLGVQFPIGPRPGAIAPMYTPKPAIIGEDGLRSAKPIIGPSSSQSQPGAKPILIALSGKPIPGVGAGVIAPIDTPLPNVKPGVIAITPTPQFGMKPGIIGEEGLQSAKSIIGPSS